MPLDSAAAPRTALTPERVFPPPRRMGPALLVLAALLLVLTAALHLLDPPAARPATAPASDFSAARAMAHVGHIAAHPHPTGTADNARVLAYLKAQLEALGYQPEVQTGMAFRRGKGVAGLVSNLVLRIPGSTPGKALMLSAHYDSAPFSPGAADNGASVAAILETLRALNSGAPLKNDLIALFTDGEEAGLLGAELFVTQHRWSKDVGLALNFDYRGNRGPIWMFQTSEGNGKLIDGWSGALAKPMGSSLLAALYKLMPNDTDLSVYTSKGIPGMNFAAVEGETSYHTQLDRADLLNQGSLQHQGESMLALARHFGNSALTDLRADDRIYFNLPGAGMVSYTATAGLALCALLWLAFGGVVLMAIRSGRARAGRSVLAILAFVLGSVAVAVACQLLWMALGLLHPAYLLIAQGTPYNGIWYVAAFATLSLGLYAALLGRLERWFKPAELALGAMACAMLLLAATSMLMPGASFALAWPALPMLAALAWLWSAKGQALPTAWQGALLGLAAVPAILILGPIIYLVFFALTLKALPVTIMMLMLALGVATPLLQALRQPYVLPLLPLLACAGLLAGGALTGGVSAVQPQPDNLMYTHNAMDGKAYWISDDARLDRWTAPYFGAKPQQQVLTAIFGPGAGPTWAQPAPPLTVAAPAIRLLSDTSTGDKRMVALEISSPRQASVLIANIDGSAVESSSVQGQVSTSLPVAEGRWRFDAYGMGATPLRLDLVVKPGKPFVLRVRDRSYGLPAGATARPPSMLIQPFGASDTTQMVRTMAFQ